MSNKPYSLEEKKRIRKNFAEKPLDVGFDHHLLAIQLESYESFLQRHISPEKRVSTGLQKVFSDVFPIVSANRSVRLDFVSYSLSDTLFSPCECVLRDVSYTGKLHVRIRLTVFDRDTDYKTVISSVEENVYMGEIPYMLPDGTFVINGIRRVIVSQLHRSPGVYFEHDGGKNHVANKLLYSARIIPYRGSWLDLEFDIKDLIYFRIDKRRKMSITILLKALGLSKEDILEKFYDRDIYQIKDGKLFKNLVLSRLKGCVARFDIYDKPNLNAKNKNLIVPKDKKITQKHINELEKLKLSSVELPMDELVGDILAVDLVDQDTGEIIAAANTIISDALIKLIAKAEIDTIETLYIDNLECGSFLADTLREEENSKEAAENKVEAVHQIYKMMRPGEPYSEEIANTVFFKTFFSTDTYDLSHVGRFKFIARTYLHEVDSRAPEWFIRLLQEVSSVHTENSMILLMGDILIALAILIEIKNGRGIIDDIDHLGNRRIRGVGELVENQLRLGLYRIDKAVKDKLTQAIDEKDLLPNRLISAKPITASLKDFFAVSQLSQFMDHTNPLAEITHKRRISALGPGGLMRDRAGFEVRDVHVTHYGRICPVETPEGQNIGLINSLALYATINKYGFLETPYRRVESGILTDDIEYLSAINEGTFVIAQSNVKTDSSGKIIDDLVDARYKGEAMLVPSKDVDYVDVTPNQIVSVAAALIPFLEHNDANRALMGSNMQRQGVPCVRANKPLVGTGLERMVAAHAGAVVLAKRGGVVTYVDGNCILVEVNINESAADMGVDIYNLEKYTRSNSNTCINQRPIVSLGDVVSIGDVLADGSSTDLGELAVGQNVLVAFMPWNGYNFEDSILVSEKLIASDVYTSIHIEEFKVVAREMKQGQEEITADVPNLSQSQLSRLDERGIIHVGAKVKFGDVLVGKVSPKGETQLTPEEKLLRAIFGEKALDVKDTSLRVPLGTEGTVVDVQVFYRDHDKSIKEEQDEEFQSYRADLNEQVAFIEHFAISRIKKLLIGQLIAGRKKITIDEAYLEGMKLTDLAAIKLQEAHVSDDIAAIVASLNDRKRDIENHLAQYRVKLYHGVDLPNGVTMMVKVFVAIKRRLQPGDKMAGRHGNKGVISKIAPIEDMPYMKDGTTVDIVLNPIGVPSRMNIGQILEVHLGLASRGLGQKIDNMLREHRKVREIRSFLEEIYNNTGQTENLSSLSDAELLVLANNLRNGVPFASPVFDGAKESQIVSMLKLAGMPTSGQLELFDGRSGDKFDRPVTVGCMYVLRLHHLVDEKVHARSTGPYSLITQQPLGGKAQFGGQRVGEMEVWALEAYGAAYTLQEMLTVKSDDISGRATAYENILEGKHAIVAHTPEAFNVLVREVKALAIDMDLHE